MKEVLSVYVTHASKEAAQELSNQLLSEKLVACANTFDIKSSYLWLGNTEHEGEVATIYKTLPDLGETVVNRVEALHSYEIPCIVMHLVRANDDYADWIEKELGGPQNRD